MSESVEFNFKKHSESIVAAYQNGMISRKNLEDCFEAYYKYNSPIYGNSLAFMNGDSSVCYSPSLTIDSGEESWTYAGPCTFSFYPTHTATSTTNIDLYNQFLSEEIRMKISEDVSKAIKKQVEFEFHSQMSSMKSDFENLRNQVNAEKSELAKLIEEKAKISKQINDFTEHLNRIFDDINQATDKYVKRVARFRLLDIEDE